MLLRVRFMQTLISATLLGMIYFNTVLQQRTIMKYVLLCRAPRIGGSIIDQPTNTCLASTVFFINQPQA